MATQQEIEQNSRYLGVWIANTEESYHFAKVIAEAGDLEEFKKLVIQTLRDAPEGSGTYYTSQNMSDDDLESGTDWAEVASYITEDE